MHEKIKILNLPLASATATVIFVVLSVLSLLIPFSLGHPQWLVGTIVNASLFLAAIFLPKKFFIPLAIFPSLGVLARGLIFGPFTSFLVYFLPFIWLSNVLLILFFKMLHGNLSHYKYFLAVFCAATAKYLFLMTAANFYFKINLVPGIFLQTMGINQLLTALTGGIVSWLVFNFARTRNTGKL